MERTYSRINWENYNSTATPLGATNLNKMDAAIYTIDGEVVGMDTTKANQSDLLTCLSGVNYNTTTGIFTFTYKNGTSVTADLNVEKIPVSFSMSADGIITMTTADGTTFTADVGSLIKAYTFENTSEITWTVTTDADGNKAVTPALVDGGIAESKLQTNFLADCRSNRLESEGYAVGTQNGVPVAEGSPYYQNNSKYYKDALGDISQKLAKIDDKIDNPTTKSNGQVLTYNGSSWVADDAPSGGHEMLSDRTSFENNTEVDKVVDALVLKEWSNGYSKFVDFTIESGTKQFENYTQGSISTVLQNASDDANIEFFFELTLKDGSTEDYENLTLAKYRLGTDEDKGKFEVTVTENVSVNVNCRIKVTEF